MKRVLVIQGHPDPDDTHFGHALAEAYVRAANRAGHEVRQIMVAQLDFSLLRRDEDWKRETMSEDIKKAQSDISWADHVLLVFPIWLGTMPALLKGFLENVLCEGFALSSGSSEELPAKMLKGKSARVVATIGMPAIMYRVFYRAHGIKNLKRNILGFCGIKPVRLNVFGGIEGSSKNRLKYLHAMEVYGSAAA